MGKLGLSSGQGNYELLVKVREFYKKVIQHMTDIEYWKLYVNTSVFCDFRISNVLKFSKNKCNLRTFKPL